MVIQDLNTLKIHKLTQAQYDRELAAGNIDENALYLTPDKEIDLSSYATIDYVNTKLYIGTEEPEHIVEGMVWIVPLV